MWFHTRKAFKWFLPQILWPALTLDFNRQRHEDQKTLFAKVFTVLWHAPSQQRTSIFTSNMKEKVLKQKACISQMQVIEFRSLTLTEIHIIKSQFKCPQEKKKFFFLMVWEQLRLSYCSSLASSKSSIFPNRVVTWVYFISRERSHSSP